MAGDDEDPVVRQYEAYPYPERDPKDEARRLIAGSPSHPVEIDHFVFGGQRDWDAPFRALVAGGGTGDALIMLAQTLKDRGTPAEIHYVDLSTASRRIAEARAAARGIFSVTFHTGDLMDAADLGRFDYVDCCGVLHHLPDPEAGFRAIAAAMAPEGGFGGMVYAPYGRSGVYPLQQAFAALTDGMTPQEKVAAAKKALRDLPPTHEFARNAIVADHKNGDAGLYDLLLHSRDTPFDVPRLLAALEGAGLALAGWVEPARYDPTTYLSDPGLAARARALPEPERAALAERLAGCMKAHRFYAAPAARGRTAARVAPDAAPVLLNASKTALAQEIAAKGALSFKVDGLTRRVEIDRAAAALVAGIDGRASLDAIARRAGLDWLSTARHFGRLMDGLGGFNLLRFSRFAAGRATGGGASD